jgi:hypothetical protein
MDFHVNKDRGEPARLDSHRFVLLFGHCFSDRIKLWSELETGALGPTCCCTT